MERHNPTVPSVIVIGAGISGLAAARVLSNASFKVIIFKDGTVFWGISYSTMAYFHYCPQVILLESRDRLGGRIHTDYSFGFPVDMGASWKVNLFYFLKFILLDAIVKLLYIIATYIYLF